jgi:hypothetical protein
MSQSSSKFYSRINFQNCIIFVCTIGSNANTNIPSKSIDCTGIPKRAAPEPCENQSKFVANARRNVQMMPEISDEELLQMAIEFEKKHPQ